VESDQTPLQASQINNRAMNLSVLEANVHRQIRQADRKPFHLSPDRALSTQLESQPHRGSCAHATSDARRSTAQGTLRHTACSTIIDYLPILRHALLERVLVSHDSNNALEEYKRVPPLPLAQPIPSRGRQLPSQPKELDECIIADIIKTRWSTKRYHNRVSETESLMRRCEWLDLCRYLYVSGKGRSGVHRDVCRGGHRKYISCSEYLPYLGCS
jgi:hypothetical protein